MGPPRLLSVGVDYVCPHVAYEPYPAQEQGWRDGRAVQVACPSLHAVGLRGRNCRRRARIHHDTTSYEDARAKLVRRHASRLFCVGLFVAPEQAVIPCSTRRCLNTHTRARARARGRGAQPWSASLIPPRRPFISFAPLHRSPVDASHRRAGSLLLSNKRVAGPLPDEMVRTFPRTPIT